MTSKQIKKAVLSKYNAKRAEDGQSPTTKLSRQVQALIEFLCEQKNKPIRHTGGKTLPCSVDAVGPVVGFPLPTTGRRPDVG
jgi:hypothetical protein